MSAGRAGRVEFTPSSTSASTKHSATAGSGCASPSPATAWSRSRATSSSRKRSCFAIASCAPTTRRSPRWRSLVAAALYGIGGCIVGTLWLLRRRGLLWKRSLAAGAIVAGINALAMLANAPQAWFSYDTAQPVWVFWGSQFGIALLVLVAGSLALALVFMAAEGTLARRVSGASPALASLVVSGCADAVDPGPHPRRLPLGADRTGADRGLLFRDQPLLRMVATLGIPDRSQHPRQHLACPGSDRPWRCRPGSWRSACSARCRCRSPR